MPSAQNPQPGCFFWKPIFVADLFYGAPPNVFESFAGIKQRKQFRENTTVFEAGEIPSRVYILMKGRAQMFLNSGSESDSPRLINQNEIMGITETIACLSHSTNLVTVTPCVFEVIERRNLVHFLSHQAEVSFRLVKLLGMNIQNNCYPVSDR